MRASIAASLVFLSLVPAPAEACTTFCLSDG
jgi:hypothetical protein